MKLRIVHIISGLERINFGIWNAVFFGTEYLDRHYDIQTTGIVCSDPVTIPDEIKTQIQFIGSIPTKKKLDDLMINHPWDSGETIVVSHGCWKGPTYIGWLLKQKGFKWIYVPHGMLEPWSIRQKFLKKKIYWHLHERRWARHADVVRAVSKNEQLNLEELLQRKIAWIPNGVPSVQTLASKENDELCFLFMARLHKKKGITPLVKAWKRAVHQPRARLIIAGPDDGELENIKSYLNAKIEYVGPVYGAEKKALLMRAHYYILPSHSEGFPTSVLEAMSFGAIPIITDGCNFPEAFDLKLGYRVEVDEHAIAQVLKTLCEVDFSKKLSADNQAFIEANYSEQVLMASLYALYSQVIDGK